MAHLLLLGVVPCTSDPLWMVNTPPGYNQSDFAGALPLAPKVGLLTGFIIREYLDVGFHGNDLTA